MAGLQLICAIRSRFKVKMRRAQPHARRGHCGLATGVTCADDDDIVLFGEGHERVRRFGPMLPGVLLGVRMGHTLILANTERQPGTRS